MSYDRATEIVGERLAGAAGVEVPPALQQSVARHNQHLVELAVSLIDNGMSEEATCAVIDRALGSYRDELVSTVLRLREEKEGE